MFREFLNSNDNKFRKSDRKMRKPQIDNGNNDDFNWGKVARVILSWLIIISAVFALMVWFRGNQKLEYEITFDQYQQFLKAGKIKEAIVKKTDVNNFDFHGVLKEPEEMITVDGKKVRGDKFVVFLPNASDSRVIDEWTRRGVKFNFVKESDQWLNALLSIIPWVLLIFIWFLIMRRMQGTTTKNIFTFGKSRARIVTNNIPKVTFNDVAGVDEAKEELKEIIEFLKDPRKFQRLGGKIPKGVLLLGPPGTGKTLLAKAVAGEAGVPFLSISGAEFVEMFVGVGASRVRDLFEQAKKLAPCIVFIDEIDAVGRHRGAGLGGGHDEREQTLNQLLVEMDGFEENSGIIVIAATNRPDILDPALLRPGRFDRQIVVDRPDVKGRLEILKVHTRRLPLAPDVNLEIIAKSTPGFSGADLANLVNEAALLAARKNHDLVTMQDFEEAKDKVMMGIQRKNVAISEREKRITAYHESGHVLVAKMLPEADPVHKVTIIPRGRALGVTTYLPIDERHTYSKEYLEAMITYALGGRAAEKIIFNSLTTGAADDLEKATTIARKMVCEWGMSERLGPLTYGTKEEEIFLGKEITRHQNYSEQTAILIDEEVKNIVTNCMERAEKILMENIDALHRLANALLERETLTGDEIDKIIKGEELPPIQKKANGQDETTPRVSSNPEPKN
ncbi:cell division protease FtsH [Candidatus Kryptobacter tengchongensis]|uniref:ATP-dependent zinc metalloprotease FtsH n=3 Tax=Kryptobacter tengchongensis TaxID=1643429 RepID=A0A916LID1_KRYT1|nr:ATP-dependent zinc metalloprotease FtsH [Candidatus Kryptobacter tengchongensis]CUS97838.1 cell division protease FtsH [Candidatus Kryptobacter tengchongensis]CUU10929.1 cell division protease FtsH [Candidatus Kryptobacter tengchongensis]